MGLATLPTGDSLAAMLERERPDFLVNVTAPAAHHAGHDRRAGVAASPC